MKELYCIRRKKHKEMSRFLECDYMCIEDGQAFFVGTKVNALFQMKWGADECEMIAAFPEPDLIKHRRYQKCVLNGDEIFCFPYFGKDIHVYNLRNHTMNRIEVDANAERIFVMLAIKIKNSIYAVIANMNRIIEIDVASKMIVGNYRISDKDSITSMIEDSVLLENSIFFLVPESDGICEFNHETKKIKFFKFPEACKGARTLCYDGKYFWISGKAKRLLIWDIVTGETFKVDDFPNDFGEYQIRQNESFVLDCDSDEYANPLFRRSIKCGNYIWLIPYKTNFILYVDINTYNIQKLEICEEIENADTWCDQTRAKYKYRIVGVYDQRYVILYSFKQHSYLQIDMETFAVNYKHIEINKQSVKKIWQFFFDKGIVYEQHWITAGDFLGYILDEDNISDDYAGAGFTGEKIYKEISEGYICLHREQYVKP